MRQRNEGISPEPFRAKVYLLVLDKLVLGAIIAIAFLIYDQWKTADQRRYEDTVSLAFKRAEYLKELTPVVVDREKDIVVRAQALVALIQTRSIDNRSTFMLCDRLLQDGLLLSDRPFITVPTGERLYPRWHGSSFFSAALLTTMPDALPDLLEHVVFVSPQALMPDDPDEIPDTRELVGREEVALFWTGLFRETVRRHSDADLKLLNDGRFLNRYLDPLHRLANLGHPVSPALTSEDASRTGLPLAWSTRSVAGIRILGNLELLVLDPHSTMRNEQRSRAASALCAFINPAPSDPSSLETAAALLDLLWHLGSRSEKSGFYDDQVRARWYAEPRIAEAATRAVIRGLGATNMATIVDDDPVVGQCRAAKYYLDWVITHDHVAERIAPLMASALSDFTSRLRREPPEDSNRSGWKRSREAASIIVVSLVDIDNSKGATGSPEDSVAAALQGFFSLPEESLKVIGMHDFASFHRSRWREKGK